MFTKISTLENPFCPACSSYNIQPSNTDLYDSKSYIECRDCCYFGIEAEQIFRSTPDPSNVVYFEKEEEQPRNMLIVRSPELVAYLEYLKNQIKYIPQPV